MECVPLVKHCVRHYLQEYNRKKPSRGLLTVQEADREKVIVGENYSGSTEKSVSTS